MGKLTATKLAALKSAGRYGDGDGLMLVVGATGSRSWVLRIVEPGTKGKRRDYGLGSAKDVPLAEARKRCAAFRAAIKNGEAPKAWWLKEADPKPTFRASAIQLHGHLLKSWKNGKHGDQWLSTLQAHVFPTIGNRPVDTIGTDDILAVLLPIWLTLPETARRVRQRIGATLDWAHVKGHRPAEAPMRSVSKALPKQPKRDGHFAAMPYADIPAFLATIREKRTMGRMAVEMAILTAARSGEVRGATWAEVNLDEAIWTIPASRMKAAREHVIPLSAPAVALFRELHDLRRGNLIFPGTTAARPLSDMTLTKALRDAGVTATVHGFRSTFRDWVAEETKVPGEIAEAALAHTVSDRVEAAYKRTTFFAKRVDLMAAWAGFLADTPANVTTLPTGRSRAA